MLKKLRPQAREALLNALRNGEDLLHGIVPYVVKKVAETEPPPNKYDVSKISPRIGHRESSTGGDPETHLMSTVEADGKHYAYPTLFQNKDGAWIELNDGDDKIRTWAAWKEAQKRGEIYEFNTEEEAHNFAEGGSWKEGYTLNKFRTPFKFP